jgi:hypothetical protein
LQHIDFPLPRKHKPALFIAIETAPLTTTARRSRGLRRPNTPRPARAPFADRSMQIFRKQTTIDSPTRASTSAGDNG